MKLETEPFTLNFRTNSGGIRDLGQTLETMIRHELAEHRIGKEPRGLELERVEIQRVDDHGQGVFDVYVEASLSIPEA